MAAFTTRQATIADLDAVAPLFDAYRQFYKQDPDLPRARQFLKERMEREESIVFVAVTEAEVIVGFCQLYPTFCSVRAANTHVLYDLFVRPDARGLGAARSLMLAAERRAATTGVAKMELSTARDNTIAQSLYESLDWVRDETFVVYGKSFG